MNIYFTVKWDSSLFIPLSKNTWKMMPLAWFCSPWPILMSTLDSSVTFVAHLSPFLVVCYDDEEGMQTKNTSLSWTKFDWFWLWSGRGLTLMNVGGIEPKVLIVRTKRVRLWQSCSCNIHVKNRWCRKKTHYPSVSQNICRLWLCDVLPTRFA